MDNRETAREALALYAEAVSVGLVPDTETLAAAALDQLVSRQLASSRPA